MKQKDRNKQAAKELAVSFTDNAWDDYQYWLQTDQKIFNRIKQVYKIIIYLINQVVFYFHLHYLYL